nr:TolC family protein [Sphingomonas elodea]
MFGDPRLQRLIALSLDSNRDLRIAALNAEAARVQLRVQRGQVLPAVSAEGSYTRQRQPASVARAGVGLVTGGGTSGFTVGQFAAQAALTSFELDLFGRLFRGANRSWSYTPAVSVPIFRGGELRGNLDLAKLRTSSAVASYEKAIQTGFR